MKYLGLELGELESRGAVHTAREICQQPDLWLKILEDVIFHHAELNRFLETAFGNAQRIILTGAGTSAFIGQSLAGIIQRKTGVCTEAIATTELVSHPRNYFIAGVPTLLISFARSGNSPESAAAVALADEICRNCYHLIITCNPEGRLARESKRDSAFVFLLPAVTIQPKTIHCTSFFTGSENEVLIMKNS